MSGVASCQTGVVSCRLWGIDFFSLACKASPITPRTLSRELIALLGHAERLRQQPLTLGWEFMALVVRIKRLQQHP